MLNIAVCDDEKYMTDFLADNISGFFSEKNTDCIIEKFFSGSQLIERCENFDAVFLDIKMPDMDGMKTAGILRDNNFKGRLIFITVLEDHVFDSFSVSAYDYIVKPIEKNRLYRTLERIERDERNRKTSLLVKTENENRIIRTADIIFCEIIDHQMYIRLISGETVICSEKMEDMPSRLGDDFFRCHRSYIINLNHLKGYSRCAAELAGGIKIPVSRLRRRDLENAVIRFVR